MKNCKRLITFLMALCLMCGCLVAHADTTLTAGGQTTATTTVSLDLGGETSYTITIPASVTLTDTTTRQDIQVKLARDFQLVDIPCLRVRVTGGYTDADASQNQYAYMTLKNEKNGTSFNLPFTVSGGTGALYESVNHDLICVTPESDNDFDYVKLVSFYPNQATEKPTYGSYEGTLTFTVYTQFED